MNRFAKPDNNDVECGACGGYGEFFQDDGVRAYWVECKDCDGTGYVKALPRKSGNVDPDPEIERDR